MKNGYQANLWDEYIHWACADNRVDAVDQLLTWIYAFSCLTPVGPMTLMLGFWVTMTMTKLGLQVKVLGQRSQPNLVPFVFAFVCVSSNLGTLLTRLLLACAFLFELLDLWPRLEWECMLGHRSRPNAKKSFLDITDALTLLWDRDERSQVKVTSQGQILTCSTWYKRLWPFGPQTNTFIKWWHF